MNVADLEDGTYYHVQTKGSKVNEIAYYESEGNWLFHDLPHYIEQDDFDDKYIVVRVIKFTGLDTLEQLMQFRIGKEVEWRTMFDRRIRVCPTKDCNRVAEHEYCPNCGQRLKFVEDPQRGEVIK